MLGCTLGLRRGPTRHGLQVSPREEILGQPKPFHWGPWRENNFITSLGCDLPYSLSYSPDCIVELCRGCMTSDVTTHQRKKQMRESSCLLLSQTLRRWAKTENNTILSTKLFLKYMFLKNTLFLLTWIYYFKK